jgi:hypothetical protein
MWSSLAVWANLTAIVYGASIEETARLGKMRIRVSAVDIVAKSPVMIEVIGGGCARNVSRCTVRICQGYVDDSHVT